MISKQFEEVSAEALKRYRIRSGLTQLQAANLVGVTRRTWIYWETDQKPVNQKVARLFLIETGQLK